MYPEDAPTQNYATESGRTNGMTAGSLNRRSRPTLPEISDQAEVIASLTASLLTGFSRLRDNLVGSEPRLTDQATKDPQPEHVPLDRVHSSQTATCRTLHRLIELVDQTQAELFGKM
jgi:hypothetical protein